MSTSTVNYPVADDNGFTVTRYDFTATTEVDENENVYTTWKLTQYGDVVAEGEGDYDANGAEDAAMAATSETSDGGDYYRQVCSDYYTDRI